MKCYDCGGEMAAGTDECAVCGCPASREKAAEWLEDRLFRMRTESVAASDSLGKARSAMFAAALLALAGGAIELLNAQGEHVRMALGVAMLLLAAGYIAMACTIRRSPRAFAFAGLAASPVFLNGVLGLSIVGVTGLSVWFACRYVRTEEREHALRMKIDSLK